MTSPPKPPTPFDAPVYVTRPMLPDMESFRPHLDDIWSSGWLTNNGDKHQALEARLQDVLGVPDIALFNNGTIALLIACQALRLSGEVIVTPFTFPATAHVLSWNNITPVFADIDPQTLTIDPRRIERLITRQTSAILGVHVYGIPCDVAEIQRLADYYGLHVVYDAAHAFGTEIDGQPIAAFGDISMFSFHATKLFHTAEGGALGMRDARLKRRIDLLKNFGIKTEDEVIMPGINGKMNELQAALGLANLDALDAERRQRAAIKAVYRARLADLPGVTLIEMPKGVTDSLQYAVIRIDADRAPVHRDTVQARLRDYNVFARKYFFPLCSQYSCYRNLPSAQPASLPVAERAAQEVLSLPLYGALGEEGAHRVCDMLHAVMAA